MKKLILTVGLVVATMAVANAQGLIKFYNVATTYNVSTNNGSTGLISKTANSFYFALLVDSTAPTSANYLTGGWTVATMASDGVTPFMATNYTLSAGALIGPGGSSGAAVSSWAYATAQYVEILGWSANMGTSWSAFETTMANGTAPVGAVMGYSNIGSVTSSSSGTVPAVTVFSAGGISTGFTLVQVPEPATVALAGLGGLSLLLFRRRK